MKSKTKKYSINNRFGQLNFIKLDIPVTIKTFNKEVYNVKKGMYVKNIQTNKLKKLSDVYYDIRTVRDMDGNIIAKRKNFYSELVSVI
ncbi:hypothetical protein [Cytobacillus kochii]|uniref:hypothetical protein n=1 Tax=Cytobacillus kochii TaxID=859143 RepID=UPI0024815CAC|nr:hypothetical protein [Cytobacillus kochii]